MKKQIFAALAFILALCSNSLTASAATITPTGNQVWWGYFNESDFQTLDDIIGTGNPMTLMAAIYVPANHEQLGASTIKAIRVYLSSSVVSSLSDMKIWVSKNLPNDISQADYVEDVKDALVADANDFQLTTPYAVNNEGFYIGYCVTSSTGYFIRVGGKSIPNAAWLGNPAVNMNWTDLNEIDLGKLAMQILVDGGDFKDYSASANNFERTVVALGETVDVPVEVTNTGKNTITSLSYTVTVNGNTSAEKTISSLNIPYGAMTVVPFAVNAETTTGKNATTITITKVNGNTNETANNKSTGYITTVETLKAWTRNVLIEEFTTEQCQYCPQAAKGLSSFLEKYPDTANRVAVACHHAGFGTDWLTLPASSDYCWFYNEGGSVYAPAFMYDRYAGKSYTPVVSREIDAEGYKKQVEKRLDVVAYADVHISPVLNTETNTIDVTVYCERGWDYSITPARLTLFVTEDNIIARKQVGASGMFIHQHVVRAVNDTWGEVINWTGNEMLTKYSFNIDPSWKTDDLKVIAFISEYDSTNPAACNVENCTVERLTDTDGIKDAKASTTAATYYNLAGQKVDKDYKGIVIVNGKKVVRK